jgi:hypothetical protein
MTCETLESETLGSETLESESVSTEFPDSQKKAYSIKNRL